MAKANSTFNFTNQTIDVHDAVVRAHRSNHKLVPYYGLTQWSLEVEREIAKRAAATRELGWGLK